jgi:hypothetical protein
MQEVLSRTVDPKAPLIGQEFYEMSLSEEANELGTPDTASIRLTANEARLTGRSCGIAKRRTISGFWPRQGAV